MNTQHLQEYLVFSEELNWTTAARRLFTTRPTLVEHVRGLEQELSCKLVVSRDGRLALTPAGRRFTRTAKELLEAWEAAQAEYREMGDNLLTVHVASSNLPWLETLLYKARRAVQEAHPYKRIEILPCPGLHSSVDALGSSEDDIVVAGFKDYLNEGRAGVIPDGLCGFELGVEDIRLFMTRDNPLFAKPDICASDLDGATLVLPPDIYRTWLRDDTVGYLASHGARVTLRTLDFSGHTEYFSFEFADVFGIVPTTLMPRYGIDAREELRSFSLPDVPLRTRFYALARREFVESENGGLLFAEMRRAAQEAHAD